MSGHNSETGCGMQIFLIILLIASVVLNATFLAGCSKVASLVGMWGGDRTAEKPVAAPAQQDYNATDDLGKIASLLGVETQGDAACDIASAIKTKLYADAGSQGFPKNILSDQQFEEAKDVLPEEKAAILADYHKFIKSLEGKRFVIVP